MTDIRGWGRRPGRSARSMPRGSPPSPRMTSTASCTGSSRSRRGTPTRTASSCTPARTRPTRAWPASPARRSAAGRTSATPARSTTAAWMRARSSSCSRRRRSAVSTDAATPSCEWPRVRSRTSTSTWPRPAPAIASWRSPTPPPGTPRTTPRAPPGLYGLEVHDLPYDAERMDVDLPRLAAVAAELQPKLIIVGGSMCLHPYDVRGVRAVADEVGAHVLYDAAHMGGLIAGGRFQQPLAEGAHAITGSTYKSFGGPPSGMILTDDPGAGRTARPDRVPGPDRQLRPRPPGRTGAGRARPDRARRGVRRPADRERQGARRRTGPRDVAVLEVPGKGATSSQHVALPTADAHGDARRLEAANVLVSEIGVPSGGALRLGTQELTRRGLEPDGTAAIAEVMARVLVRGEAPELVRPDVVGLRRQLGGAVRFVRPEDRALERSTASGASASAALSRNLARTSATVIGASTEPRGWSTAAASVRPSAVRTADRAAEPVRHLGQRHGLVGHPTRHGHGGLVVDAVGRERGHADPAVHEQRTGRERQAELRVVGRPRPGLAAAGSRISPTPASATRTSIAATSAAARPSEPSASSAPCMKWQHGYGLIAIAAVSQRVPRSSSWRRSASVCGSPRCVANAVPAVDDAGRAGGARRRQQRRLDTRPSRARRRAAASWTTRRRGTRAARARTSRRSRAHASCRRVQRQQPRGGDGGAEHAADAGRVEAAAVELAVGGGAEPRARSRSRPRRP